VQGLVVYPIAMASSISITPPRMQANNIIAASVSLSLFTSLCSLMVCFVFFIVCLWLELKLVQGIASANDCRYNAGNRADC